MSVIEMKDVDSQFKVLHDPSPKRDESLGIIDRAICCQERLGISSATFKPLKERQSGDVIIIIMAIYTLYNYNKKVILVLKKKVNLAFYFNIYNIFINILNNIR